MKLSNKKLALSIVTTLAISASSSIFALSTPQVTYYNDRAEFTALDMNVVNTLDFSEYTPGLQTLQCGPFTYTFCNFTASPLTIFEDGGQNWIGNAGTNQIMAMYFGLSDMISFVGFDINGPLNGQIYANLWHNGVTLGVPGIGESTSLDPITGISVTPLTSSGFVGLRINDLTQNDFFERLLFNDFSQSAETGYSNFIIGVKRTEEKEDKSVTLIPTPGSVALMMIGVIGMVASSYRRK